METWDLDRTARSELEPPARRHLYAALWAAVAPVLSLPLVWGLALYHLTRPHDAPEQQRWAWRLFGLAAVDLAIALLVIAAVSSGALVDLAGAEHVAPAAGGPAACLPEEGEEAAAPLGAGGSPVVAMVPLALLLVVALVRRRRDAPIWAGAIAVLVGSGAAGVGAGLSACFDDGGWTARAVGWALVAQSTAMIVLALGLKALRERRGAAPAVVGPVLPGAWAFLLGLSWHAGGVLRLITALTAAQALWPGLLGDAVTEQPLDFLPELAGGTPGALLVAGVAVLGPVAEEVLFRGVMLPALHVWLGARAALVLSALAFAAVHGVLGPYLLVVFVIGLALGWARLRSGRLGPSIALHALNNAVALAGMFAGGAP